MTGNNMPEALLSTIRTKYHTLSENQKQIADYILANTSEVILMSISALATRCNTSEPSVMRFLRKLDYDSYQVFRVNIAQEIPRDQMEAVYSEIREGDSHEVLIDKVIAATINSIKDLKQLIDPENIKRAVDLLYHAKQISFIGVGSSAFIAFDAYHKFLRLGMQVAISTDTHIMSMMASLSKTDDVIFAISHSGESRDILDCIKLAKNNNTKIIAFTSYQNSSITRLSDVVLFSCANETRYRSDALVSRILQLIIIDILYVNMVLRMGKKAIDSINKSRLAVAGKKR
jgi:DNA-binding MurR/RpiR family transcriptional regulator